MGLVQLQLPVVETPAQLAAQAAAHLRAGGQGAAQPGHMDLVVFPEYALHGLSMTPPGDHVHAGRPRGGGLQAACTDTGSGAASPSWKPTPAATRTTAASSSTTRARSALYYRKLHPWVPVEPWEPGNLGIPVCEGPNGSKLALIICHDGMFPEMAREAAYKGAEIIIRTAGYTAPIRHAWQITNQANAFSNLAYTASVCMCGSDGSFDSMGEGMFCNFDGTVMVEGGGRPDEIITCRTAARPGARGAQPAGAWRTTSTSSTTAATWR